LNDLLRQHCHDRLYVKPLHWTAQHLQLLKCRFVRRQRTPQPTSSTQGGLAPPSESEQLREDSKVDKYPRGHFVGPTVFDGVRADMTIGHEEIFGPVASVTRAADLDEAIELIHGSSFANATSIFTTSGCSAREFRYRVGVSMIGVNIGVAAPMAFFPFGGTKGSFFGDLKAHGQDAVEFYTDKKVVISRW